MFLVLNQGGTANRLVPFLDGFFYSHASLHRKIATKETSKRNVLPDREAAAID